MKRLWMWLLVPVLLSAEVGDFDVFDERTGFIVMEVHRGELVIHDRFLEAILQGEGIFIPKEERSDFGGKERVFINDRFFQEAFKDVYCPQDGHFICQGDTEASAVR